jgi:hypothetical protein
VADPYAFDQADSAVLFRTEFGLATAVQSPKAHTVITGVTETVWTEDDLRRAHALFVSIAADRRLLSRHNLGMRELERDRRRR